MGEALKVLSAELITSFKPEEADDKTSIVDSMPVITCAGRNRQGKVAREIADKGFCSTKNLYYYGVKIHLLAHRVRGSIPYPEMISISAASENDSTVFKRDLVDYLENTRPCMLTKYIRTDLSTRTNGRPKGWRCSHHAKQLKGNRLS